MKWFARGEAVGLAGAVAVGGPERAGPQGRGAARSRVAAWRRAQGPARALRQGQEETSSPSRSLSRRARTSARTRDTEVRRAARHSTAAETCLRRRRPWQTRPSRPVVTAHGRANPRAIGRGLVLRRRPPSAPRSGQGKPWGTRSGPPRGDRPWQDKSARPVATGPGRANQRAIGRGRPFESAALRPSLRAGLFDSAPSGASLRAWQTVGEQGQRSSARGPPLAGQERAAPW